MTGAVAVAALVGLASLLAGVALGWHLRRTNNWCPQCGDQLTCPACGSHAEWRPGQLVSGPPAPPGTR